MIKKITTALGALAIGGISFGAVACGSTGSSTPMPAANAQAQQNASNIVQSDGFTVIDTESASQISSTFGDSAQYISSAAVGVNNSQDLEVAVVFGKSGGQAILNGAESELNSDVAGSGLTVSANGDVLKVTGSETAFENSNLGSGS